MYNVWKIMMDELEHLNQEKPCFGVSMQGFKKKFGGVSRMGNGR